LKLRRIGQPTSATGVFLATLSRRDYYCALVARGGSKATEIARLARENAALKREVARLQVYRAMAYRDPLTGVWNRRYFEERLQEELSRSQRAGSSRRFSVMVLDLNDFKSTNDRYGHPVGDVVLKDVGEFLVTHLRHHDVACRTGGDEFSVLLPDLSADDCGHLVDRLRRGLETANAGRRIPISLSIGTASWPDAGDTVEALLTRADEAMYGDKHRHRATKKVPTAAKRTAARRARAQVHA
jgi:diguanylate cyclase (GGDEF)-like protein